MVTTVKLATPDHLEIVISTKTPELYAGPEFESHTLLYVTFRKFGNFMVREFLAQFD